MHFLFFILILSGDIGSNPAQSAEYVLDIIRSQIVYSSMFNNLYPLVYLINL